MSELVMDLSSLRQPELLSLCAELGVEVANDIRKPLIIQGSLALEGDESDLIECWEIIKEREANQEKRRADEKEKQLRDLELKCLELEVQKANATGIETQTPAAEA